MLFRFSFITAIGLWFRKQDIWTLQCNGQICGQTTWRDGSKKSIWERRGGWWWKVSVQKCYWVPLNPQQFWIYLHVSFKNRKWFPNFSIQCCDLRRNYEEHFGSCNHEILGAQQSQLVSLYKKVSFSLHPKAKLYLPVAPGHFSSTALQLFIFHCVCPQILHKVFLLWKREMEMCMIISKSISQLVLPVCKIWG